MLDQFRGRWAELATFVKLSLLALLLLFIVVVRTTIRLASLVILKLCQFLVH